MKNQLTVDLKTHILSGAHFIQSPNYDERPTNVPVELIVIHGISLPPGRFGGEGVQQLFTNRLDQKEDPYYRKIEGLKVSSHLFINRWGQVTQFVPFDKRAWHAGLSSFAGREKCNDFSIGIELEGTDHQPYTASQYEALEQTLQALLKAYPTIDKHNIKGHNDIAPKRKTDPGKYFMWSAVERFVEKV